MKMNQSRKNFIWNMIGLTLNSFISLFYLVIVTRINGVEKAGVFSFIFAFSLILYTICLYGGRIYQVSDLKNEFTDQQYFSLKHITNFIVLIISIIYIIINNYNIEKTLILMLLMLTRIFESYSDTIYGVFQKNDRLDYVGKSLVLKSMCSLLVFFIVDIFTHNVVLSMFGACVFVIAIYFIYDINKLKKYEKFKIELDIKNGKKILFAMKYVCLFSFITSLIINVPRFIVDYMLTDDYLGYFSIIIMIPTAVGLLGQFVIQPEVLSLSKKYFNKNNNDVNTKLKKIVLLTVALSTFCMICAYFIGPAFLKLIYNLNFNNYRLILLIVVIGGMFNVIASIFSTMLTIMRKTRVQFYLYLIVFVVGTLVSIIIINNNNFYGPFISYLFIMALESILFYIAFKRYFYDKK